jgi:hypothetical protein
MRTTAITLFVLIMLSACTRDDSAEPRPPIGPEDVVGQSFVFKVKPADWSPNGTPGDDTYGFAAINTVNILTDAIAQDGTVQVYVQRANNNWSQLPVSATQGAPGGANWRYTYRAGSVQVFIDKNGASFEAPDQVMELKVVVFAD